MDKDKMEFCRQFCGKRVYNDEDWDTNAGYFVLRDVCAFWVAMKKAGFVNKGMADLFDETAKKCCDTMNALPLIELVENVLSRYDCVIAQDRASLDETVVEKELLDPDVTDLLWEAKEYKYPEE